MSWTNIIASFAILAIVVVAIGAAQAMAIPSDPDGYVQSSAYGLVVITVVLNALSTFKHYKPKTFKEAFSGDCGASIFIMALLVGILSTTLLTAAGYSEPDIAGFLIGR